MTNTADMMINHKLQQNKEAGVALLITLLLMGVLLGVSTSLMSITLKQYQLSGIARSSEIAFQAANAGLECILYHDFPQTGTSPFAVPTNGTEQAAAASVSCMGTPLVTNSAGDGRAASTEEQRFVFNWGNDPDAADKVCSIVSIYKFSSAGSAVPVVVGTKDYRDGSPCPAGSVCTVIQARGYNVPCIEIGSNSRVVEREYTQVY